MISRFPAPGRVITTQIRIIRTLLLVLQKQHRWQFAIIYHIRNTLRHCNAAVAILMAAVYNNVDNNCT